MKNKGSPLVSIIVLNYNNWSDTIELIKSLKKVKYINYDLVIVDNMSTNDSVKRIKKYFADSGDEFFSINYEEGKFKGSDTILYKKNVIINSDRNGGFGYGNNIGIRYALKKKTDYILIINNDTVVDPGFLQPLVEACESNKRIGIASGSIFYYDYPEFLWFDAGKFFPFSGKIRIENFKKNIVDKKKLSEYNFLSGCFWFIPSSVVKKSGLIDEDFFMYYEDVEYCLRVLKNGFELLSVPESKIWHKIPFEQKGKTQKFSIYWRSRNSIILYKKILKSSFKKYTGPFLINVKLFIQLFFSMQFEKIITLLKGIYDGIKMKV